MSDSPLFDFATEMAKIEAISCAKFGSLKQELLGSTAASKPRRGPARFRQQDVTRAIKAAKSAGIPNVRVKIDKDGAIVVESGGGEEATPAPSDEWDDVL
jgi:hypothetical protein